MSEGEYISVTSIGIILGILDVKHTVAVELTSLVTTLTPVNSRTMKYNNNNNHELYNNHFIAVRLIIDLLLILMTV